MDDDTQDIGRRIQRVSRGVSAPVALRARVDALRRPAPRRRRGLAWGLAAAGAAAAVVLAVALALPGGGPSVAQAAQLGTRPPTAPAPRAAGPALLAAAQDGVRFPDWAAKFGWKATGTRRDEVGGRPATTVFYENPEGTRTAAYTIVGGDALDPPSGARSRELGGTTFRTTTIDGRRVVTWERGGRTCVLSSAGAPDAKLVALADWRGKGRVAF